MAITFSACSNNSKTESETSTQEEGMSADSSSMNAMDTTKTEVGKMAQDSIDAAHGHMH
ncbi:MAG: hypothetical protein H7098_09530 [Oligoflexus sp.]|nr:hypothetical protein [Pseudopedobacter sp.]